MGRIQSLQVLRFFAALGVVVHHASINFGPHPFIHGAAGVDVFFVLSGAVIGRAAERRPRHFLFDRLTRIFPIYWLLLAPWVLISIGAGHWDAWRGVAAVTLLPLSSQPPYLPPAWTLSFELVFYGAMALVLRGARPWMMIAAFAACFVANLAFGGPVLRTLGSPLVVEFGLGLVASRLAPPHRYLGWLSIAVGVAIIFATPSGIGNPADTFKPGAQLTRALLWGLPSLLIVSGAMTVSADGRFWRPFVFLGDASYSLYLSHELVLLIAIDTVGRGASPLLLIALCVLVSAALHLWIERPLIRWARGQPPGRLALAKPAPDGLSAPSLDGVIAISSPEAESPSSGART